MRRLTLRSLAIVIAAAAGPRIAHADDHRLVMGLEMGGGTMLSSFQRSTLGYGNDLQTSVFGGLQLMHSFEAEAAIGTWWFPSSRGYGRGTLLGPGLRYWFLDGGVGSAFANANVGVGINGGNLRFMFDASLGYAFHVAGFELGPTLRYGQVSAGGSDDPYSAMFWSVGATAMYRFGKAGKAIPAGTPSVVATTSPATASGPHPVVATKPASPPKLVDRDADGIDDLHDACPDVPQGQRPNPDQLGCPDGDEDKDGLADHQDSCPKEATGLHPDPARAGCPLADRDHDSVPDVEDHCPNKAGAPSPDPKRNGCPGLVRIDAGKIQINRPVFFATNSDRILPKSFPVLKAVAEALRLTEAIRRVAVEGHTDAQGKSAPNLDLSQRRAESVRVWLIGHGVDAARLEAHGYGDTRPLATNKIGKGRATNRRVEFLIVDPASDVAGGSLAEKIQ